MQKARRQRPKTPPSSNLLSWVARRLAEPGCRYFTLVEIRPGRGPPDRSGAPNLHNGLPQSPSHRQMTFASNRPSIENPCWQTAPLTPGLPRRRPRHLRRPQASEQRSEASLTPTMP